MSLLTELKARNIDITTVLNNFGHLIPELLLKQDEKFDLHAFAVAGQKLGDL